MAKYLLVSFKTCPWVQRAAIVLREKGIYFEFRHIEPDNRPDWFLAISPHKKVPVLRIDDRVSLFESNAIAEYLDETVSPRLHPEDPVVRAVNRAWTDYVPTFAEAVTATAYADSESDYRKAAENIPVPFERLEGALEKQGSGPFFKWAKVRAGGRRLRALLAALFLPRPGEKARPHREVSTTESLGHSSDQSAIHSLLPGRRVRGTLSREPETAEQVGVAICADGTRRGGVMRPSDQTVVRSHSCLTTPLRSQPRGGRARKKRALRSAA